jgi:RNA binding exosome subunit
MSTNQNFPKLKIREISFRCHIHATESFDKIYNFFLQFFPFELKDSEIKVDHLTGTYGNPIHSIEISLNKQKKITLGLEKLTELIPDQNKIQLEQEFESRLDEKHHFYFRIAKQLFILNQIVLGKENKDVIQVIIAIFNKTPYSQVYSDHIKELLRKNHLFLSEKI